MSEDEIRKEISQETLEIKFHIEQCMDKFKKANKNRLPRMYPTLAFYSFTTRRKNDILLLLEANEYKRRNCPHYGVYFITQFHKVYQCTTFGDDDQDIIVFTNHFLKRYNERMNLHYTNKIDVLKHFITNNASSAIKFDSENPNMFYGTITTGMTFGYRKDSGFTYQTTFVDNTKLFANQTEYVNAIKDKVNLTDIRDVMKRMINHDYECLNTISIPKKE